MLKWTPIGPCVICLGIVGKKEVFGVDIFHGIYGA